MMEKKQPLQKHCWENWISTCRRSKLDPYLSPCTSINSKWNKNVSIRFETLMLVQERARNTLELIGIGNYLLNRNSATKRKDWQIGLHETKKLLHHQRNGHQIEETAHRVGEKSLPAIHLTRD
jgi:hypothetical protein